MFFQRAETNIRWKQGERVGWVATDLLFIYNFAYFQRQFFGDLLLAGGCKGREFLFSLTKLFISIDVFIIIAIVRFTESICDISVTLWQKTITKVRVCSVTLNGFWHNYNYISVHWNNNRLTVQNMRCSKILILFSFCKTRRNWWFSMPLFLLPKWISIRRFAKQAV